VGEKEKATVKEAVDPSGAQNMTRFAMKLWDSHLTPGTTSTHVAPNGARVARDSFHLYSCG
jgi:hypothetical protein